MNFAKGHKVRVKRDIIRKEGLYANAGEEGIIEDVFQPPTTGYNDNRVWYAKVRIGNELKTLRLTSIDRVKQDDYTAKHSS